MDWGSWKVDYDNYVDSPYVQALLEDGLKKAHEIIEATTYDQRHKIIWTDCPPRKRWGLYHTLQRASWSQDATTLDDIDSEAASVYLRPSFGLDTDLGPETAWRLCHAVSTSNNWVNSRSQRRNRLWGYVMWDIIRLEDDT